MLIVISTELPLHCPKRVYSVRSTVFFFFFLSRNAFFFSIEISWKITLFAWLSWNAINLQAFMNANYRGMSFSCVDWWNNHLILCIVYTTQCTFTVQMHREAHFSMMLKCIWRLLVLRKENYHEKEKERKTRAANKCVLCQRQFSLSNLIWRTKAASKPTKLSDMDECRQSENRKKISDTKIQSIKLPLARIQLHMIRKLFAANSFVWRTPDDVRRYAFIQHSILHHLFIHSTKFYLKKIDRPLCVHAIFQ